MGFLFAVGVSIGALDEIYQSYIPNRSMSFFDWLADAVGVIIGVGIFVFTPLGRTNARRAARAMPVEEGKAK
jgi:VanZ family protein